MAYEKIILTKVERIMLANQYLILEKLYPENSVEYERMRRIVEAGYEADYESLSYQVSEGSISTEICFQVMDVLDMYRALHYSYRELKDKDGIEEGKVKFPGFDGNNESEKMHYAAFLFKQGKWEELIGDLAKHEWYYKNSHSHTDEIYQRMLSEWNNLDRKYDLSSDEILQILNSRIHPEKR